MMNELRIGLGVGIPFCFIVGILIGIGATIGVYKLKKRMKGKMIVFSPWPRIEQNPDHDANQDGTGALHNPTYGEEEFQSSSMSTPMREPMASSMATQQPLAAIITSAHQNESSQTHQLYEEISDVEDEPLNEAERDLESIDLSCNPYAIHDLTSQDDQDQMKDNEKKAQVQEDGAAKPGGKIQVVPYAVRDVIQDSSEQVGIERQKSERKRPTPQTKKKPTRYTVTGGAKKPVDTSVTGTSTESDMQGSCYSQLDPKSRYAILEPHIDDRKRSQSNDLKSNTKENYAHLNH